jgi:ribosomal protein S18 acetylase RimI-like enzyme
VNRDTRIERVDVDAAGALASLGRRTFVDAYGVTNPPSHVAAYVAQAFATDAIRHQLMEPANVFLVARQDRIAIGYVKLRLNRCIDELVDCRAAQIERIYVDRLAQRNGVGRALLKAGVDAARAAGEGAVWLAVWRDNLRAQQFYRDNGFATVGTTFFMLGPERQEDLIMARHLP